MKILYRIEYMYDDWNDKLKLVVRKLEILKKTPKGFWIQKFEWTDQVQIFVLADPHAKKAYAHMTIEGAREYFIRRNKTRKRILTHQLNIVEKALNQVETFYNKPKNGKKTH